jgi:hypothetical protein
VERVQACRTNATRCANCARLAEGSGVAEPTLPDGLRHCFLRGMRNQSSILSVNASVSALHAIALLATLSTDTGRFTIYKLQHPVGAETYETTVENGVRTLSVRWAFRYIPACCSPA